jgi:hypothetical protein
MTRFISLAMRGAQAAAFMKMLRGMGLGGIMGGSRSGASTPSTSEIASRFIHMVLYHDTGRMDGRVLEGTFRDSQLSSLNLEQLKQLYAEIQQDADSVNLLAAYLDREHGDWHTEGEQRTGQDAFDNDMSETQALEILGLESSATREDVVQAHRRLMQKMHPDRGGSTYLAAKINAAKELLMQLRPETQDD